ncbi:MAG: PQQ-dependent sugar dehydrogenase [Verrucomicrobiota bacterium]|nr:PQQ-dependent sugar dehydrogenase [Verrucomicrobiota bacterium]
MLQLRNQVKTALCTILFAAGQLITPQCWEEDSPTPHLIDRDLWLNTRLVGSPEPPPPFKAVPIYTNQVWRSPMFLAAEPQTKRMFALLHHGQGNPTQLVSFEDDPKVEKREVLLELPGRNVYSFCFDPNYTENGFIYLFNNLNMEAFDGKKANRISRVTLLNGSQTIDLNSEHTIIEWRSGGHDGGGIDFGLDGMLYISTGDGTSDSDNWLSGQTLDDLLGGVLRIDIRQTSTEKPYKIPTNNPFIDIPNARGELYAYGLRNPWRLTVDKLTGHVWVGNNGQDLWESVHMVKAGDNYGWSVYEGSHPFYQNRIMGPHPLTKPTSEHPHSEARSITGGIVYYGRKWSSLRGYYIYGDYGTGKIWGIKHDGNKRLALRELADTTLAITGFATTHSGELLIADHSGGFYKLETQPRIRRGAPFPRRLSETGLFADTKNHKMKSGIIEYSVIASGWNDTATAKRWMAVPEKKTIGFNQNGAWSFPNKTALIQTLTVQRENALGQATPFRIETRVLLRQQNEWTGYSYRWNEKQTDAELVSKEGDTVTLRITDTKAPGGFRRHDWIFPSRADCMTCHSRARGFLLGLTGQNTDRMHNFSGKEDNQLLTFSHIGLFNKPYTRPKNSDQKLVNPYNQNEKISKRVRSYLHINCSSCHVHAGGGNSKIKLGIETPNDQMSLIGARPQHNTFGISNAMLVSPGLPDQSVLIRRLSQRGRGQMPPLVSGAVDEIAVSLFRKWISQMKPEIVFVKNWKLEDFDTEIKISHNADNLDNGKAAYSKAGCTQCHRLNGAGGSVGPDLSDLNNRMNPTKILESIIEPSRTISEEYIMQQFKMSDGKIHIGKVQEETENVIKLQSISAIGASVHLAKALIDSRKKLNISNMPPGTVNTLKKEEILDLINYLTHK